MRGLILLAATACLTASTPRNVERYVIDANHTEIGFTVRHLMITNVKGRFDTFSGEILLDQDDITRSAANVTIDAASVNTGNDRRDNDLRGDDFFNSAAFPHITFHSKRVEKNGAALTLVGDLTIRDVTREVAIPFELSGPVKTRNGKKIGIAGSLTINRFDYNLRYNRLSEAVQVVAPEVKIELNVEAATVSP